MTPKTNINTIAKLAEVSTTTVSNFINCTETIPISAAKRTRIMEVMRDLKYRPSAASSSLRRNSSLPGKVVFIFGGWTICDAFRVCTSPMIEELVVELSATLKAQLNLAFEIRPVEDEKAVASWNETIADAEAVVNYGKLNSLLLELCERRNIPLVEAEDTEKLRVIGATGETPCVDYVYWDSPSHLEKALNHAIAKGAKKFAFVSSWNIKPNNPEGFAVEAEAKIARFKELTARKGLSGELLFPPRPADVTPFSERRNAYEFLKDKDLKGFDAVMGHNDMVAQGITAALQRQGLVPGSGIMVYGEGDYKECRYSIPTITSVSYSKRLMADKICGILRRRLADNHPLGEKILIPSELIERESSEGWRK